MYAFYDQLDYHSFLASPCSARFLDYIYYMLEFNRFMDIRRTLSCLTLPASVRPRLTSLTLLGVASLP